MRKMRLQPVVGLVIVLGVMGSWTGGSHAADIGEARVKGAVDKAIRPLLPQFSIPGMAVGIAIDGKRYVYDYGVMSTETEKPVTGDTLFEIGSVSKTFTATLAAYAAVDGKLSLSDSASNYLPDLRGSAFDKVSLLNLGTHTPGGLPLQVPDGITNDDQLMAYFKAWKPSYAPGTYRTYSNPSIGLLGVIAANSMKADFGSLLEGQLFPAFGMTHSYVEVPSAAMTTYAQGYTKQDKPVRMNPGVLGPEAYGVRSTAADMIRFVEANMQVTDPGEKLRQAIANTHTGYFKVGGMTQDLIWEQYPYPVDLKTLLAGNSTKTSLQANPVTEIVPPLQPQEAAWINKTGSTNGFGAYVAFVPAKRLGIVILANKNYPIEARVTAAHRILTELDRNLASAN